MKPIIYQFFPRWFTNECDHCVPGGTIEQNGVGKLNEITDKVLAKIKDMGVTHVWPTGIVEHATQSDFSAYGIKPCNPHVVKGKAGSPYAIRDWYDISPEIAVDVPHRMAEFEAFVERAHRAGLRVIIDFVPNHVAREYRSDVMTDGEHQLGEHDNRNMFFDPQNNFYYMVGEAFTPVDVDLGEGSGRYEEMPARATGNDCFSPSPSRNDWYETIKLNYGVDPWNGSKHFDPIPDTWRKMLDVLMYWAGKGVDGFRCDMAHMVPVEFWHWAIEAVKRVAPELIFIAEIYDVSLYRSYIHYGGFDYLYDKVTLYDTLFNILKYGSSAHQLTSCWQTVDDIRAHMLNFLENHDELRIASPQFAGDATLARPAAVVSATISCAPFMIYAGQELGEQGIDAEGYSGRDGRTTIFDYWSVPSLRAWNRHGHFDMRGLSQPQRELKRFYTRLLTLCNSNAALSRGTMYDLMWINGDTLADTSLYAYLRHNVESATTVLVVANFGANGFDGHVRLTDHALDYCGLKVGNYALHELLTDSPCGTIKLEPDVLIPVSVPAHDAVIIALN